MTGQAERVVSAGVLIGHPIQHFAPGLRLLSRQPGLHARVYYWDSAAGGVYDQGFSRHIQWSTDLHSGYDWWATPSDRPPPQRATALWRRLRRDRPDVILCFGWASPIARAGIAYATLTRTPVLYYGDTNWRTSLGGRHPRLRSIVLRTLFRGAAGAVSTGTFNREFYIAHGLSPGRIHPGVYPTDVDLFEAAAKDRRWPVEAVAPDRPVVIGFAGKFTPVKAAHDLIAAAARLPRDSSWEVRLLGDGPLRPRLEAAVADHDLTGRVRFLGFRNTHELPAQMTEIDIMVMPSHQEPRGLVPIEAMAAGAAVVVSSATGVWGPGDAVQHGETGLVYPVGDIDALAGCLRRLLEDPRLRQRLARAGQVRARRYGPRDFAETVAAAFAATTRRAVDVCSG